MKTAQDYLKSFNGGRFNGGFNSCLFGESYSSIATERDFERTQGWELANTMINEGKVFYVHNFHQLQTGCNGCAFIYGSGWACNGCNTDWKAPKWWVIKTMMDGNAWCCIGEGFENLQESDNVAYGDTKEEAIQNYGNLFINTATAL